MEAPEVLGSAAGLSGPDLIEDLCCQIAAALANDPDLRESDSHERYSATVEVQLRLHDIDEKRLERTIIVGEPDSDGASHTIALEIPAASPREVRERSGLSAPSLEIPTFENEQNGQPPATTKRRWYAPRGTKVSQ